MKHLFIILVFLTTFKIFADRSAFHEAISNKSTEVVHRHYEVYPTEPFNNQQEEIDYIASAIETLVYRGRFLSGGLDEHVSPNNLRWNDSNDKVYIGAPRQL